MQTRQTQTAFRARKVTGTFEKQVPCLVRLLVGTHLPVKEMKKETVFGPVEINY